MRVYIVYLFLIHCVIYRKGNSSQENDKLLHQILERVGNQGYGVLLTGDFNLPNIDWNTQTTTAPENSPEQQFLDAINDSFLTQHVKEITRVRGDHRPTTLDLIITNDQNSVENITYLRPIGKSDHCVIATTPSTTKRQLNYFKGDYMSFKEKLREINWENILLDKDVNEMTQTLNKVL